MAGAERGRGERLHRAIARRLGTAILAGEIAPRASLEGEIEQAETLGVSRTSYREALKILVAKGMLESRPRTGTQVTERERWNLLDPEVLEWMFAGEPDPKLVGELFELRSIVEPAAAALAAQRRTGARLAAMDAALLDMARCGLASAAGRAADQRFHRELFAASGNSPLASLSSTIAAAVELTTTFKARASTSPRDGLAEHRAVFEAVSDGDGEGARRAMQTLLANAHRDMELDGPGTRVERPPPLPGTAV